MHKAQAQRLERIVAGIQWERSQWSDGGYAAVLNGILVDVTKDGLGWRWTLKPSSSRCEWPELCGSGSSLTLRAARIAASRSTVDADAAYPKIDYT